MGLFDTGDIDFGQLLSGVQTPPAVPPMLMPGAMPATLPPGTMAPGPDMMTSPISPDLLAKNAAARGIMPPPVDLGGALTGNVPMPRARPGMPVMAQGGEAGAPMDITSDAQKAGAAEAATAKKPGSFADALKGVTAPKAPETQRISSPSAPRPNVQIKGGDIIALLQSLQQAKAGGLELPGTLGAALRR